MGLCRTVDYYDTRRFRRNVWLGFQLQNREDNLVRATQNNLDLTFDIPDQLIGDSLSLHLRQVMTNLVGNASKFTWARNGLFALQMRLLALDDQHMALVILKYGGTALRLSIFKRPVTIMAGEPVKKSILAKMTLPIPFANMSTFLSIDRESFIYIPILLAEDNLVIQKLAVKIPEKYGPSVEIAENGSLAVDAYRSRGPHYQMFWRALETFYSSSVIGLVELSYFLVLSSGSEIHGHTDELATQKIPPPCSNVHCAIPIAKWA
ncbi:hypothetical protein BDZ89DRAFT_1042388 [Hymenopellis radicata]|nr:hypothetical protein BDZ89DRAFT_1042388 [Hymenopellis radicata]